MSKQTTVRGIDDTVAEECTAIGVATRDDGWVEAEIVAITESDGHRDIELVARHPLGERLTWDLNKPQVWDDSSLFVRLVNDIGYGAGSVDQLVGESLLIHPNEKNEHSQRIDQSRTWRLHDPDRDHEGGDYSPSNFLVELLVAIIIPGIVLVPLAFLYLHTFATDLSPGQITLMFFGFIWVASTITMVSENTS